MVALETVIINNHKLKLQGKGYRKLEIFRKKIPDRQLYI